MRSVEDAHVGAVTFVQRSDSSIRLNPHSRCPVSGCEGGMRILEIATERGDIARILGAKARAPPPPRPSRSPRAGQLHLAFG